MKIQDIQNTTWFKRAFAISGLALFLGSAGASYAGGLSTSKTIDFTSGDFDGSGVGRLNWAIYSPEAEAPNTEIYGVGGGITLGAGSSTIARIGTTSIGNTFDQAILWKIEVPDESQITSFTWGFDTVRYRGAAEGDTTVVWQYSADASNWVDFSDTITLDVGLTNWSDVEDTVNFSEAIGSTLYIRILKDYNTNGASNAFYVYSDYTDGGISENSFIEVTVIPEPKSTALVILSTVIVFAGFQRTRKRNV